VTRLKNFFANHNFGIYKAKNIYILPLKGMCSGSRDHFKFWEISDTVFGNGARCHSGNGRLIGNCMWHIKWHHYWWTLVT